MYRVQTVYTYDAWFEKFKPVINHLNKYEQYTFETYDEEVEYVWGQPNKYVWTEVDGDGGTYIVAGKHFVNRIQYYITENPWEDENTEVPTWTYRMCDCTDDEQYEDMGYNPDCEECWGEGTIDIPCETVEALKDIYGDDVNANV